MFSCIRITYFSIIYRADSIRKVYYVTCTEDLFSHGREFGTDRRQKRLKLLQVFILILFGVIFIICLHVSCLFQDFRRQYIDYRGRFYIFLGREIRPNVSTFCELDLLLSNCPKLLKLPTSLSI